MKGDSITLTATEQRRLIVLNYLGVGTRTNDRDDVPGQSTVGQRTYAQRMRGELLTLGIGGQQAIDPSLPLARVRRTTSLRSSSAATRTKGVIRTGTHCAAFSGA